MSYSERYSTSVSYSGSVSYSYPASQNGGYGTAHYDGEIPIDVTVNVDTQPFDGSVNHFNSSVDVLTGSVVAMHAAQCAAIQQTGQEVSAALIDGFFGTINTELSQQLQALDSAMKAGFGLIMEQGKAVGTKKIQMEGDFNRICSRYIRLFDDLDNECYKRIYALDKPSFSLSEKVQRQLLSETSGDASALNILGIEEESSIKSLVFVSSLYRRVLLVLQTMRDYINQESDISSLVNSLLSDESVDKNIPLFSPVVWIERDTLEDSSVRHESFIPVFLDQGPIRDKTDNYCSGVPRSGWEAGEEEQKEALDREFKSLAESCFAELNDEAEQRTYKTMLSLWQNSKLVYLKRSK